MFSNTKTQVQTEGLQLSNISQEMFLESIDEQYDVMTKKQIENPNLIIPKNFNKFIHSSIFMKFLVALNNYCNEVIKVENKQRQLDYEAQYRISCPPQIRQNETDVVSEKLRLVSEIYCIIILKMGEYNVMYRDQNFFETMIYFTSQVLKKFYSREDYKIVEEELNRIFRTNTFNLIKKRHFEDEKLKRFPVLKESNGKETVETIIQKMEKRSKIPKVNWKYQLMSDKSEVKPYFIKLTPCGSVYSRSPVIAMIVPSAKERLFQYERERRQREASFSLHQQINQNDLSLLNLEPLKKLPEIKREKFRSFVSFYEKNKSKYDSFQNESFS